MQRQEAIKARLVCDGKVIKSNPTPLAYAQHLLLNVNCGHLKPTNYN
jgi:hypothetical protein